MLKKIYFTLLVGVLFSFKCKQPINKNSDFVLVSATKMKYFGGVYGSPMVTVYTLNLQAKRDFNMDCDSSYAEGKIDELIIQTDSFNTSKNLAIKKGQTITCILSLKTESIQNAGDFQITIPGSLSRNPPLDYPQSVYLKYEGGHSKYLIVNKIEEKKPLMAP